MKRWKAAEIEAALAVIRRGGSIEDLALAVPGRTARALGVKSKRLQAVVDGESKAHAVSEQRAKEALTPEAIVAEYKRLRAGRTDWVTEQVLQEIALSLGITLDHMRDTMLRHWGIID